MTDHKITTVTTQTLKTLMDKDSTLCLIDVREQYEWQINHIAKAIHIPKDDLSARIEQVEPDKNKPIYLHCKGGVRSLYAAHCLMEMGYKCVYSVDGGIDDWEKNGYPMIK